MVTVFKLDNWRGRSGKEYRVEMIEIKTEKSPAHNTRYSLLPVQCWFQGFPSYQSLLHLDREVLRNRQQTIPPNVTCKRKKRLQYIK